jgi:hypothetical protein
MFNQLSLPDFAAALIERFPKEFTTTHTMLEDTMMHLFVMCNGLAHADPESMTT